MKITIRLNGEPRELAAGSSVAALVASLDLTKGRVAVERNREIVPMSAWDEAALADGDEVEIVHFVGGGQDDSWTVAGRTFNSRLIVGTGKYKDYAQNAAAAEASGAEIVTVAVRRVNLTDKSQPLLTDYVKPDRFTYLPNTAGCFTADDALRTLRLAREAGGWTLVKLEVLADQKTLFPDVIETIRATEVLVKEGFDVMVYTSDDPVVARRLEDAGAAAIMPLGAPIGSGLGIQNRVNIRLIVEQCKVPVLVDAGVGTASDAAIAMELGCDGVLMNTAIAEAKDPVRMARAMKAAVEAGRDAYLAGRMPVRRYADPSSPLAGLI
ncbi:sulfur carrier protein ThiS [Sandaracinobacter neustonicus]|uniref:Thiazole synthase n=1 Tax=Sandaracinobacter neustonicus TaxID=1715348 RepID=A0A501XVJ8_9SPHN|nr:sulfur carrier protein ThiS [Sandaracinobacter neustonicus]TPE64600.1 sulfur carrier protein ThiS [Sandaracinobacter neustonicus]